MDKMEMLNRQNTILAGRVAELKKELWEEKRKNERMKNCQNCKHQDYSDVEYCYKCSREYAGENTKDNWELKE